MANPEVQCGDFPNNITELIFSNFNFGEKWIFEKFSIFDIGYFDEISLFWATREGFSQLRTSFGRIPQRFSNFEFDETIYTTSCLSIIFLFSTPHNIQMCPPNELKFFEKVPNTPRFSSAAPTFSISPSTFPRKIPTKCSSCNSQFHQPHIQIQLINKCEKLQIADWATNNRIKTFVLIMHKNYA